MNNLLEESLKIFLQECKESVKQGKLDLIPRDKNMESIIKMGLTIFDIEDIICSLTVKDYYRGPSEDYKYKDEYVWEFLKKYDEFRIYIKLKFNDDKTVCISFHKAEY